MERAALIVLPRMLKAVLAERTVAMVKKDKIRLGWGTDILFLQANATRLGLQLVKMSRWASPAEALTIATATHAEVLQLSARRNPHPHQRSVVQEGALADLLLVDSNPLVGIRLIRDPAMKLLVIMRYGKVCENLLR